MSTIKSFKQPTCSIYNYFIDLTKLNEFLDALANDFSVSIYFFIPIKNFKKFNILLSYTI